MTPDIAIAALGIIGTALVNTAALFYWGGSVRQMLRDHDRRISRLEGLPQRPPSMRGIV